jgi:hypothetical protein
MFQIKNKLCIDVINRKHDTKETVKLIVHMPTYWDNNSFNLGLQSGTPELGGQEGQPPSLPFTRRGKEGKGALSI